MHAKTEWLNLADHKLAYQYIRGTERANKVGVVFLSGFGSDMMGTKASFCADCCEKEGIDCLRFDYRGHGQSDGVFTDFTIGDWLADALNVFDALTEGPQILVGSSMGGWLALLLALKRPERVKAFVGIAAAPDFTKDLILDRMTEPQKEALAKTGVLMDAGLPITKKLLEEGAKHCLLAQPIPLSIPVHLLQGMEDAEVPFAHALRIVEKLASAQVRVSLIKGGDHRLSRPEDLDYFGSVLLGVINHNNAGS